MIELPEGVSAQSEPVELREISGIEGQLGELIVSQEDVLDVFLLVVCSNRKDVSTLGGGEILTHQRDALLLLPIVVLHHLSEDVLVDLLLGQLLLLLVALVDLEDEMFVLEMLHLLLGLDLVNLVYDSILLTEEVVLLVPLELDVLEQLDLRTLPLEEDADTQVRQTLVITDSLLDELLEHIILYELVLKLIFVPRLDLTVGTDVVVTISALHVLPQVIVVEDSVVTATADEGLAEPHHLNLHVYVWTVMLLALKPQILLID